MTIEQHLLIDMKLCNIIKDDDSMIWTVDNMYKFCIQRYDNIKSYSPNGSRYIIVIDIKDAITDVTITTIKMSEIDVLCMLEEADVFIYELWENLSSSIVRMNSFDTSMELYQMILTRIDEDLTVSDKTLMMEISKYNPTREFCTPLVRVKMSDAELSDLMFSIYFCTILDIDIPWNHHNRMEEVITNFIDNGYLKDRDYCLQQ